ncbi:hypothetical protein Tsubulata_023960 [Turnera subulata]|uniref:RING-type E3 ubiquitin transferase n=1 Tax=Turnera subulata TaxID=218843 RepID=A0A9Q0F7S4_9ROSI|nr:hypothetical protein Tsubulata_023960 [Turnera subulata]
MPVFAERGSSSSSSASSAAVAEQIKLRKPRNHFSQEPNFPTETDPNINTNPRSAKPSTISSLFLSHFSPPTTLPDPSPTTKKKGAAFRGLGCTAGAAQQVSVPAVIRSSAEWEGKRVKKKKGSTQKQKKKKESLKYCSESSVGESSNGNGNSASNGNGNGDCSVGSNVGSCGMVMQDVWCGPGIGLSSDAVVGSVDCVVAARRNVSNGRGKIDARERERERDREREREREKERSSCTVRRTAVNPETLSFLDTDPVFLTSRHEPEVFRSRYYRHVRHPSPDGLAEILMLQNSFIMGGRTDRFSSMRLDIDHMTYEQLLELGDKIGYVNTGLKEDEISRCVSKIKLPFVNDLSLHFPLVLEKKCTICQEEYETDEELGKLDCAHGFHLQCIKQWLAQKNACPVCKTEPVDRG